MFSGGNVISVPEIVAVDCAPLAAAAELKPSATAGLKSNVPGSTEALTLADLLARAVTADRAIDDFVALTDFIEPDVPGAEIIDDTLSLSDDLVTLLMLGPVMAGSIGLGSRGHVIERERGVFAGVAAGYASDTEEGEVE